MLSPYFDHVERQLRSAVRREAHLPWYARLRRRHPRGLVVVLAALVIAGPAVAAVSLLQRGSSVAPRGPLTPNAFNGVAIRSGARLLPLRVADPAGGPAWGMRVIRTSRGLVCLQVGRVAFGTVGALGRDGAFGNDGRFHPFSANYQGGSPPCSVPDARGDAFINVADYGVPTSALFGNDQDNGCRTSAVPLAGMDRLGKRRAEANNRQPLCSRAELRDVYYGLLGPDAVSIAHATSSGGFVTTSTAGSDGAYLVVLPFQGSRAHPGVQFSGGQGTSYDARLFPGAIRAVRYRDGHTCQPSYGRNGPCPPVGYASPPESLPTPAQVASRISVHVQRASVWCVARGPQGVPEPCPKHVPPGFQRLRGGPASVLVVFGFISRLAVTNGHSYYYFTITRPPHPNPRYGQLECAGAQDGGQTNSDYAAGQRVVLWSFENLSCQGIAHGNMTLVITTGPSAPAPMPAVPGQSAGREVGHFSFNVP